jgi:hypothetical protein
VTLREELTPPPNLAAIHEAFPAVRGRPGIVFTYAPVLHNPSRIRISPDLWAHEETHGRQQTAPGMTPEAWWERYLADPEFRLGQEAEAYRAQYEFARLNYGREQRRALLRHIVATLSGPIYGYMVSPSRARTMVT